MIFFTVAHEGETFTFEVESSKRILDLKQDIMEHFTIVDKYIDLDICLERPIRSLGKFNVDRGIMPRTMDRYSFDRFEMEGKTIPCKIRVVDKPQENKPFIKKSQLSRASQKSSFNVEESQQTFMKLEPVFDINNKDDFPPLG
jgi:hypothetical protein